MENNNKNQSIEAMLREHERLELMIKEKFRKELTILFTDICGYTNYMETHGDLKGRAMLQKHNDILIPIIEKYNGAVIKTIGDAVMAKFEFPAEAVYAAVDIQNGLEEYNKNAEDKIHVKIGINSGNVLMDNGDLFGDAVNVAARIQSKAGKDEILISDKLFREICEDEEFVCKFHDTAQLKGKAEPVKLYQVIWRENNIHLHSKSKIRSHQQTRSIKEKKESNEIILHLEAMSINERLKLSIYEQIPGETGTVRHYEEIPVPLDTITERCREIAETLNKANRQGCVSRDMLLKLRGIGQIFFDDLLTHTVKEKLRNTDAEYLILNIDDTLVHVPWELLHDGKKFLCQRFSMGRLVRTKQTVPGAGKARKLLKPLNMLILADPGGDLNGAYSEGVQLRDNMDKQNNLIHASLRADEISADYIREKIRDFDILHYAGHSDYDRENPAESGWRLSKGRFSAHEIMKMAGTGEMPSLIFSNACQSARTEEWKITSEFHDEIFGLANAFVLAGVRHYVGTFWEILDEPSRRFAIEFYKELLSGISIGKAVRNARMVLIEEYGEETIVWASYLLYGDPAFSYLDDMAEKEDKRKSAASLSHSQSSQSKPKTRIRASEADVLYSNKVWENTDKPILRKKRRSYIGFLITGIMLLTMLLGGYKIFKSDKEIVKYESSAMTAYQAGNFEEALSYSKNIEDKQPDSALGYLIQGHIYLRQGKIDDARKVYNKAVQASEDNSQQKISALMGLGRIASIQNQKDTALVYYQQAAECTGREGISSPPYTEALMAQAMIMNEKGEHEAALKILEKAQNQAPENHLIGAAASEIRNRVSFLHDQDKQERINILVKELIERSQETGVRSQETGVRSQETGDRSQETGVRSQKPEFLTVWLMDFESVGYSAQEGETQLLGISITNAMLQNSKIRLVERVLLDKLLEELKLGTSKLSDQRTALSLGKIMAARVILSGKIIHAGNQKEVSVRMIETETGLISGAVSESFGIDLPVSAVSDKLSEKLLNKIKESYWN